ncbi:MAG: hypothetical protein FWE59_02445 [Oscillospiraceae bacterium]|nr:hypothetical protein [Oscillospiraceae bacterium]
MRKAVILSGIAAVLLLPLLLSGWVDADATVARALRLGNEQYASQQYGEALRLYEAGLAAAPENRALCFNAAQAAYLSGAYGQAIEYYEKSDDSLEKYLHAGNAAFKLGDALEDPNEKLPCYALALDAYREGMILYPENVSLKYNYELVMQKIEELLEEMDQEGEGEQGEGEEGEEGEESEGEQGEGEETEGEESETGDSQEEGEEGEENEGKQAEQGEDGEEGADGEDGEDEQNMAEIARILEMLEAQEEESLKNNQEVIGGKDGTNGW